MSHSAESLRDLLERIAIALEALAEQRSVKDLPEQTHDLGTPFPWNDISVRTRNSLRSACSETYPWVKECLKGKKWPLTCEDLIEMEPDLLIQNVRNFGSVSAMEISNKLLRIMPLGSPEWYSNKSL